MPVADLVHNLARRLADCPADAEDLVQETYLRAWTTWTTGRRPDRVAPWLATICLNLGRDRLRRAARHAETAWDEEVGGLSEVAAARAPKMVEVLIDIVWTMLCLVPS